MEISIQEALRLNKTFIDLRSPKEHAEDTIPGSINIPLFDDSEHRIIGTLYHNEGQERAFSEGLKFVAPKLDKMIAGICKFKEPILFCWRGGLRSQSVCKYLDEKGIKSYLLKGGYRAYRRYVHEEINTLNVPKLVILYGLAGAGKTKLIRKLDNAIDLEGFAQHRASLFGGLGLNPRSQKMFESLLLQSLQKKNPLFIVEGESKRIGDLHVPQRFYDAMNGGIKVWVDCSKQKRIQNLMDDYGKASKQEIKEVLVQLKKFVPDAVYVRMLHQLESGNYEKLAELLLDEYYDKKYLHNLTRTRYDFVVDATDEDKAITELNDFLKSATT